MESRDPVILSSVKAAGVATLAGGSVSLLAATTTGDAQWIDFIKSVGIPTALALFLLWAWWEAIKRQNQKSDDRDAKYDEVQREFRAAYKEHIGLSNQLMADLKQILIEQNRTLAQQSQALEAQSVYLREISSHVISDE